MSFCKLCGHRLEDNDRFCGACGAPVEAQAEPVQAEPVQAEPVQTDAVQADAAEPVQPIYATDAPQEYTAPAYAQPVSTVYETQQPADKGGFLYGALGCCVPVVGLILFLVWKDTQPKSARAAGIGALVSVGCAVLLYALLFALGIAGALYGYL